MPLSTLVKDPYGQNLISSQYAKLLEEHGYTPSAMQMSQEGIEYRVNKLLEIGQLNEKEVLDLGCGLGELYPLLKARYPTAMYTGIDIVPGMINGASVKWPDAKFLLRDVLKDGLPQSYDYIFLNALFNNARNDDNLFMKDMLKLCFKKCRKALGFNFISTRANYKNEHLDYHDPALILNFCLDNLSPNVMIHHHYERCDVSIFVFRTA